MSNKGRRTPATGDGLRYPFANVPGPGVITQVAPGIYWMRLPLPLRLNHVNAWLLAEPTGGQEGVRSFTVVDTGLGDQVTRDLWERVLAEVVAGGSGTPGVESRTAVSRVVLTHFHPDHSGAAGWLVGRTGTELLMSRGEHEQALAAVRGEAQGGAWSAVERLEPHGLPEATRKLLLESRRPFGALVPDVTEEFVPLADGQVVTLGGREWQVILGYGHSPEHVSLFSLSGGEQAEREDAGAEDAGILISGDMLLPHISSHVGSPVTWARGNPVASFLRSLERLAALPEKTLVLPGHGVPFIGVKARVAALLEHHEERCARMLAAVGRHGSGRARLAASSDLPSAATHLPPTAGDLLEALFPKGLDPLQVILAMNETIAHLAYLEDRGDVERVAGVDGKVRWVRKGSPSAGAGGNE